MARSTRSSHMADVVDAATRSRMMSGIRGKHTKLEMVVRRWLHRKGFRFRIHDKRLPGNPDLKLPKYRSVVFVNGCFWHKHECHLFKWPSSRKDFWNAKLARNCERDARNVASLMASGWRVAIVWECAIKGQSQSKVDDTLGELAKWLLATSEFTPRLISFPSILGSAR